LQREGVSCCDKKKLEEGKEGNESSGRVTILQELRTAHHNRRSRGVGLSHDLLLAEVAKCSISTGVRKKRKGYP